ncbi:MAG: hypothetical protein DBY39_02280 [Clostridiales bacterium]|nr:MAG: hypothetical protein DBY39_02280 [Clostridiales bacterium]
MLLFYHCPLNSNQLQIKMAATICTRNLLHKHWRQVKLSQTFHQSQR